jgi:hypothetical protein
LVDGMLMLLLLPHQSSSYFGMPSKVVSEGLGRREDIVAFPATKVRIQRHFARAHSDRKSECPLGSEIYTGELIPRARMASQQLCKHSFLRMWGVPLPAGGASVRVARHASHSRREPLVSNVKVRVAGGVALVARG